MTTTVSEAGQVDLRSTIERARLVRVYCPECGTVRWPESIFNPAQYAGTLVFPHRRQTATGVKRCKGGTVDPILDRAP